MFQSNVFFKNHPCYSISRKRDCQAFLVNHNSSELAEGEGVTATSLGILKDLDRTACRVIHRVPSVEGATATSLGNLNLIQKCKEINRKKRSNELFLSFDKKTGE